MKHPASAMKLHPADKRVYSFGEGSAEGGAEMKNLLGGKGANLAEMCALGLPVPPGFTITTEVCTAFYAEGKAYPQGLAEEVEEALAQIEQRVGRGFGDATNPLLVSVRSGARASMPGMMDTVLNLGLNDVTVKGLAEGSGNPRFAYDSYRRFIQMYSDVVLGLDHYLFEEALEELKRDRDAILDTELDADALTQLVDQYKRLVEEELGKPFPQEPREQLWGAIGAVFTSWMNPRAITYRELHDIPAAWGTAVNVQAMVFGNMGEDCATGVAFTRNPSTGEKLYYGEYLVNAQGEDVVAGIRTPQPLTIAGKEIGGDLPAMEEVMPDVFAQLVRVFEILESHYRDMQDIEFTVESRKLWMLQTRAGKRTAAASVRIAVEMVGEGLIEKDEALLRVDPLALDQLLHPTLDGKAEKTLLTKGLPASPGAASGTAVFTAELAEEKAKRGEKVILVRQETSPEDIRGMHAAEGILTARGGMTSHAAVVARGMGKPCVCGASEIGVHAKEGHFIAGGRKIKEGDLITLDGSTGEVMLGEVPTLKPSLSGDFARLMGWADEARTLAVRTNADTPEDAAVARHFGAEGIGLCRTEHMFFDEGRIQAIREMILSETTSQRKAALAKLLPMQREDFAGIFRAMGGLPVTIRLLDPPLHEFLPHSEAEMREIAKTTGKTLEEVKARTVALSESNPMLGHRGCRLGITYPEIYEMQARAIFEAVAAESRVESRESHEENNRGHEGRPEGRPSPEPRAEQAVHCGAQERGAGALKVTPEIMIPLVMTRSELAILKTLIDGVAKEVAAETGVSLDYKVGTMIELPRAALMAGEIAELAEFFSFGTNDLTQTTFGISRDDAGNFIEAYKKRGVLARDPFVSLDTEGVGELIRIAEARGRATREDLKLGICGEHGGDPASIAFCQSAGLDYVSCSPYRVPIARLAAAQAALKQVS